MTRVCRQIERERTSCPACGKDLQIRTLATCHAKWCKPTSKRIDDRSLAAQHAYKRLRRQMGLQSDDQPSGENSEETSGGASDSASVDNDVNNAPLQTQEDARLENDTVQTPLQTPAEMKDDNSPLHAPDQTRDWNNLNNASLQTPLQTRTDDNTPVPTYLQTRRSAGPLDEQIQRMMVWKPPLTMAPRVLPQWS